MDKVAPDQCFLTGGGRGGAKFGGGPGFDRNKTTKMAGPRLIDNDYVLKCLD